MSQIDDANALGPVLAASQTGGKVSLALSASLLWLMYAVELQHQDSEQTYQLLSFWAERELE